MPKAKQYKERCVLICKSQVGELKSVEKAIRRFAKENKLSNEIQYRLLVAATEAVNNAILHGNKFDSQKRVRLSCCIYRKKIVLRVRDFGLGFDPTKLPNPTTSDNLLKEHGRGVFLIRALMDEVKFKKLQTGLVVEMAIRRI